MPAQSNSLPGWPHNDSPFHAAELKLQERFGVKDRLDAGARRGIRSVLIEQHQRFFAQLPFLVISAVDESGQPWASVLTGRPGFAYSPEPTLLRVNALPSVQDAIRAPLGLGALIGVLGIDFHTKRRNRMNGRIEGFDESGFRIRVDQSFGNCPRYIQSRSVAFIEEPQIIARANAFSKSTALSSKDCALIKNADTFYIASANLDQQAGVARGADVSHRGGRPGFIRIIDDHTAIAPDFVGNYFFNTLGNLRVEPRCGLLFVDFKKGDLLQVAARAEIIWDGQEVELFAGAERLIRFHILSVACLQGILPIRSEHAELSTEVLRTGIWKETLQTAQERVSNSK